MYGSLMNEEIFAAVVRGDKPETLVAVEPFHNPGLLGNNRSCIFRHRRDGKTPTEEEPPLKPVLSPQPTSAGPQNFLVALFSAFVSLSLSLSLSSELSPAPLGYRNSGRRRVPIGREAAAAKMQSVCSSSSLARWLVRCACGATNARWVRADHRTACGDRTDINAPNAKEALIGRTDGR
jgi:hypothetical protein